MSGPLVHDLLAASAERFPERIAVVDRDRSITYGELEARSNRLARLLAERGVRRGDRIGLFLDKSLESIVGVYGVLKTGAAYVPFDPQSPATRLGYIARDAGVRCLLSSREKRPAWAVLREAGAPVDTLVVLNASATELDDDASSGMTVLGAEALDAHAADPPAARPDASELAYILYTSGSTGEPKGVMLSHLNARSFVDWAASEFDVSPDDRLSSHAPLHFDLSVFDLFAAASAGAAVALVPPDLAAFPPEVARFIEEQRISVWYSVPSALTMLALRGNLGARDLGSLRVVLFAGEVFPTKHLIRLMELVPGPRFCNLYGPTETNVCTWYEVPRAPLDPNRTIPIGRAIPGVDVLVTTESGEAVPAGEVGELRVGGPTVMHGYWGDPERTARVLEESGDPPSRVYRTGDLVRQTPGGDLLFLGRRDAQVKSRGYRIELGEVEAALNSHPLVVECAVVPIPDELLTNTLRAYVVAHAGVIAADLTAFCKARLPLYMVPDVIELTPALPKSSTGKIDRRALAAAAPAAPLTPRPEPPVARGTARTS